MLNWSSYRLYLRYYRLQNIYKTWIIFAACESGTFGNACSMNCHCVNQTCDPINGTCPDGGCQRGYKGTACSTST